MANEAEEEGHVWTTENDARNETKTNNISRKFLKILNTLTLNCT